MNIKPFLIRVCDSLRNHKVRYAVVGGHAVALHGAIRGSMDVDVVLNWSLQTLRRAEMALNELGLVSRLPLSAKDVFDFRDEYVRNRNFQAWHFWNPQDLSEQVNLVVNYHLTGHSLKRSSLIKMKQESGRPQDLHDVKALEKLK